MQTFVADVHLGKLARMLRVLGFDTAYSNRYTKNDLTRIAVEEQRVLLSRNPDFSKIAGVSCYPIIHEDPRMQLKMVVENLQLRGKIKPFTRCTLCNGVLEAVSKEDVAAALDENTAAFYNEFFRCTLCHQVYWKGAHYHRMKGWIDEMMQPPA